MWLKEAESFMYSLFVNILHVHNVQYEEYNLMLTLKAKCYLEWYLHVLTTPNLQSRVISAQFEEVVLINGEQPSCNCWSSENIKSQPDRCKENCTGYIALGLNIINYCNQFTRKILWYNFLTEWSTDHAKDPACTTRLERTS